MRIKTVYFRIGRRTFGVKFYRDAGRWMYYRDAGRWMYYGKMKIFNNVGPQLF